MADITVDQIFEAYSQVLKHRLPDQVPNTIERVYKAGARSGGVGDPATGLALMWMTERPDGSMDPSELVLTINESTNPVFIVESETAS